MNTTNTTNNTTKTNINFSVRRTPAGLSLGLATFADSSVTSVARSLHVYYMCVCVCVCVYIYIYIYIYK